MGRSPASAVGVVATTAAAAAAVVLAAAALPRVAAKADPFPTLAGTYPRFHGTAAACSASITILPDATLGVPANGASLLNASALSIGGGPCGAGTILVAPWSAINDPNSDSKTLGALRGLFGQARYTVVVTNLESGGDFWAGLLPTGLTCGVAGGTKLTASTALFVSSNSSRAVAWGASGTVPAGESQMATVTSSGGLCLYASRAVGSGGNVVVGSTATPTPTPTPGPTADPTAAPTAAPTATPDGDDDDEPACFPAAATVELSTGSVVRMDALRVGDAVRVAPGGGGAAFSPVYLFTHADGGARGGPPAVRLTTASGAAVTASAGHYVYAGGRLVAAAAVAVGDTLQVVPPGGGATTWVVSPVTAIAAVPVAGLYNPQTLAGEVVVDGVRASTYTTAVAPRVATALLAPLRAAWYAGGGAPAAAAASALDAPGRWVVARLGRVLGGGVSAEL
ncbi:hypothetical protein I4F81_005130 [Pyropia yezoensis]|uniref:Uncharacterized protein n=1 Tax=Pyropia yezoensis TaxID=2788 RepID=A0ACC3BXE6_PYRYE|nr:hypothetical protein I4F81_005130 [Neopyropia yezoensis]